MNECDIEYPPLECDEPMEESLPLGLEMRPMEPGDLIEVKRLHEQCFPVRYDMAFYENVVRGVIARGKGNAMEPLYTQVAVVPSAPAGDVSLRSDNNAERSSMKRGEPGQPQIGSREQPPRHSPPRDDCSGSRRAGTRAGGGGTACQEGVRTEHEGGEAPESIWPLAGADGGGDGSDESGVDGGRERGEMIVGLITCQVMPLSQCRDQERLGLQASSGGRGGAGHSDVVYILTLGTETSYRRQGIGRALLRRCVCLSRQEKSIGAVYLHVITTNPAAHRFYESEGFVQVCCISDYYRIEGELYDCFLYALFVNGAKPPGEWGWDIQSLSRRLRSIISFFMRTLGQAPEERKLAAAVAAAGSSSEQPDSQQQQDKQQQQQQQQGQRGPQEIVQDEESGRAVSSFAVEAAAAGAAAAAHRRGASASKSDGDGVGSAGKAAASPLLPPGRRFAWSPSGTKQSPAYSCDIGAPRSEPPAGGELDTEAGRGGAAPTVTLWDAAGLGAWGRTGAESRSGAMEGFRDACEVVHVGSRSVVDVSSNGGTGRHWGGLGREPV